MLFQKLLFFVQGYSGAANSNIDADDHENGGIKASFAEDGRDVQFGDVYDRKALSHCVVVVTHILLSIPVLFMSHHLIPLLQLKQTVLCFLLCGAFLVRAHVMKLPA
jgi:hypothetical protein